MKRIFFFGLIFIFVTSAFSQSKWTAGSQAQYQNLDREEVTGLLIEVLPEFPEESMRARGIEVKSKAGSIWSVRANKAQIDWMISNPQILTLELSSVHFPLHKMDYQSRVASSVLQVQQTPLANGIPYPYTGKGVIVGIIDIGFQPDHPNFYDTNGQVNRVVRYWDQLDNSGNPPAGFSYGSLHTTLSDMLKKTYSDEMHGTHVTGIAGGSGYGSVNRKHAGVAYESDLVMVNIRYYDNTLPPSAKGDLLVASPSIIDGLNYIFQYADSVGKPAVANLSWGMYSGPHDGTSLFDRAIENLTGSGKIFVGAAGNSGWGRNHVMGDLNKDTLRTMPFNNRNVRDDVEDMFIDMWGSAGTEFSVALGLCDTNGVEMGLSTFYSTQKDTVIHDILTVSYGGGLIDSLEYNLSIVASVAANGKPNILFEIYNYTPQRSRTILHVKSDSSVVHAWNSGQILKWGDGGFSAAFWGHPNIPGYTGGNSDYMVGENGGTGKQTITAGAYNASKTILNINGDTIWGGWGNRSGFSSRGPTVDGRMKPDISAPGENVISSFNRHYYTPGRRKDIVDSSIVNGTTEYWSVASGTSMASPNTCGVLALFLQADSSLTPDRIKSILSQTALLDNETGNGPGNEWGWGKLDAYAGLLHINEHLAVPVIQKDLLKVYPNPGKSTFTVWGVPENADFTLFDFSGRTVQSGHLEASSFQTNLGAGLYVLHIQSGNSSASLKIQILP
ncbi:MAG: S8 family serine peptidase [Bacteroidetes bacterium]|nr:S8 family serine peptidase [Bacteroidota bacterium]